MKPSDIDLMTVSETLTQAKHCLWDGVNERTNAEEDEFVCHALRRVTEGHEGNFRTALNFLKTYGMETSGSWFCRESEGYCEASRARQTRRHAFLSVAIRHATKLGI